MFDEIVSIEPYDTQSCRYDITVENNHNFFANGILVHNCQNLRGWPDVNYLIEEKLDGSSVSLFFNNEFGVCSRNLELKLDETNAYVAAAFRHRYPEGMTKLGLNIAVQGELCGPGIQGNPYKLTIPKIFVFDIWLIDQQRYAVANERHSILDQLESLGVDVLRVPVVSERTISGLTRAEILLMAEGKSVLNQQTEREGLVFKSAGLVNGQVYSFKSISNKFLLKQKD